MVHDLKLTLDENITTMDNILDEDRKRRLRLLEERIQDPLSIGNIDSLLDTVQALYTDCDHVAVKKVKNVEVYMSRCELHFCLFKYDLRHVFYLLNLTNLYFCSLVRIDNKKSLYCFALPYEII